MSWFSVERVVVVMAVGAKLIAATPMSCLTLHDVGKIKLSLLPLTPAIMNVF